ncbi:Dual specificity protein phosphatase 4 [Larimichthys crocea]|uniref:Uncharacterized protein n=1 Tax=Larimichthys crocea TaxID=215358 RepID=A0ACD3QLP0_LARCR|nr:Dual specificity protein phosphatase 4 [Larimichthys crocea]
MEDLGEMDCPVLKRLLKDDSAKCLLLDCRSFLAFSAGHIRGAVNARCNTIVRRRAKGSCAELGPDTGWLFLSFSKKQQHRIQYIIFDHDVSFPGGYDRFFTEYPEFCLKTKSLPPLTSQSSIESSCSSCGTPHHDQGGPVEILPFLYLGSALHASKKDVLDGIGISALLNVSADCPNHFEGTYQYKCIPVEDNHKEDISCWFLEAIEFIDSVRDSSGRVLVHCQAGISRSATICLAYLMKRKRVRLDEAFEFVRRRRSIISPNFSFMGQLLQFESQLLATSCAAEAAATASPLLGPKSSTSTTSTSTTPTSPFIFNFPVSVVNSAYLHHSPITTSPGC